VNHWPAQAPAWRARWIAPPADQRQGPNVYFRARRRFVLEAARAESPFLIHIAAESAYRLFVNGADVGHGPARGTRSVNFFDSFDTSRLLRPGENWVGVEVHSPNVPTFRAAPAEPAVILQSDDGRIATDATWETQAAPDWRRDVPLYNFQIGYMEWNDRRKEPGGWAVGLDVGVWLPPSVVGDRERLGAKQLLPRDVPPLARHRRFPTGVPVQATTPAVSAADDRRVAERMTVEPHDPCAIHPELLRRVLDRTQPLTIHPPAGGKGVALVFDFSGEVNGWFELEVTSPAAGTIVDLGYEEELTDGRLNLTHFSYRFADRYVLREGRQTVGNRFASRGFRFVQVVLRDLAGPVQIHRVEAADELYPYAMAAAFDCSDPLLTRTWTACVRTLQLCTTDTLVDCPWRENTLYFNDMLVEALTSLQAFGDRRVIARCYRLATSQPSSTHLLPAAVPAGVIFAMDHETSIDRITLPSSNLLLPGMLEEYVLYTGDAALANECEVAVRRIFQTVSTWEDDAGLVTPPKRYWNMIDWSYPMESIDGRCTSTLNWMYVGALNATARLAESLGWSSFDPDALRRKASRLARAIDARFWDERESAYVEYFDDADRAALYSQLSAATALLSGGLPPWRTAPVAAAIEREDFLAPELFMHHFVLRAMASGGRGQAALDRVRRYWGPIVRGGSSTIWEMGVQQHGKSAFEGAGSLCHGFSTTPVSFFQTVILGVRPTKYGFAECSIAPTPLDLAHARGTVPTPHGHLDVSWQRVNDVLRLDVVVPPGVRAVAADGRVLAQGAQQLDVPVMA
jgi:hypothetical protein